MKRILLFITAAIAAVSCAETNLEEKSANFESESATAVSIIVAASDNSQSRIAVDEQWAVSWEEGDALSAWSSSDNSLSQFTMASFDPEKATFEGSVTGDFRLVYPYSSAASVDGSSYTVDISTQEAGVNSTYMISNSVIAVEEAATATSMAHIGAAAQLVTSFENLSSNYTLTSVAISGVPTSVAIDLSAEVEADNFYGESTQGTIVVSVDNVAVSASENLTVKFNILPLEVAAGGSIGVKYYFANEAGESFTLTSEVVNSSDAAVSFARATYNSLYNTCDMSSVVANSASYTLSELSADAIPEVDVWVITDTTAEVTDFAGMSAAIAALADSGRAISLEFPNLESLPDYTIFGATTTSSTARLAYDSGALYSLKADAATSIGQYAFYNCANLAKLDLPKVETIATYAFWSNVALTEVVLPSATYLDTYVFRLCTSLVTAEFPALLSSASSILYSCTSLKSADMPLSTALGNFTFMYCDALESVNIPSAVTIGNSAFRGCSSLTSVDMPAATSFGTYLFRDCTALTSMSFATNEGSLLTAVGSTMFYNVVTTDIDLTLGELNAEYVIGETLTFGTFTADYKSITFVDGDGNVVDVEEKDENEGWNLVTGADGSTTGVWTDDILFTLFSDALAPIQLDMEIYESIETPGYYRFANVYTTDFITATFGSFYGSCLADTINVYTYINATNPDEVWLEYYDTGYTSSYGQLWYGSYVPAYSEYGDADNYGTLKDGIITFPKGSMITRLMTYPSMAWFTGGSNLSLTLPGYTAPEIVEESDDEEEDEAEDGYTWEIVAAEDGSTTAVWTDDLIASIFAGTSTAVKEVEVYQATELPGYYRIKNIYTSDFTYQFYDKESGTSIGDDETYYTYINATNPDAVWIKYHNSGYYPGMTYGYFYYGSYVPDNFEDGSTVNYGTLVDGYISFPRYSIYGYMSIYGGGWSISNGELSLLLPGGTVPEVETQEEKDAKYTWSVVSAADGSTEATWTDDILSTIFTDAVVASKSVTLYQADELPGYYRIENIYTADFTSKIWGTTEEAESGYAVDPTQETIYTYIDATDPTAVWIRFYDTGYYISETYGDLYYGSLTSANTDFFIYNWSSYTSDSYYGTLVNGVITFPSSSFLGYAAGSNGAWIVSDGGLSLTLPGYSASEAPAATTSRSEKATVRVDSSAIELNSNSSSMVVAPNATSAKSALPTGLKVEWLSL